MSKHIAVITAADGTVSAAGPFATRLQAERWSADLELTTNGELAAQAIMLESPATVMYGTALEAGK